MIAIYHHQIIRRLKGMKDAMFVGFAAAELDDLEGR